MSRWMMWHLSGGQVPPTASMQPAGPPGRQLIEKDRLWETYRGRNPAYSRHHEPAATNESDRHVSYDLGWITSYYRGTEYYIYNIYIKYITWITLHLQKPKIRRIGARFENVLFKKGTVSKGRVSGQPEHPRICLCVRKNFCHTQVLRFFVRAIRYQFVKIVLRTCSPR